MRSASVGLRGLSRTSLSARPLRFVAVLAVAMVVKSGKRHCFCVGSIKYSLDILLRQIIFPPGSLRFSESLHSNSCAGTMRSKFFTELSCCRLARILCRDNGAWDVASTVNGLCEALETKDSCIPTDLH